MIGANLILVGIVAVRTGTKPRALVSFCEGLTGTKFEGLPLLPSCVSNEGRRVHGEAANGERDGQRLGLGSGVVMLKHTPMVR